MKKTAISLALAFALVLCFLLAAAPNAQATAHQDHCVCGGEAAGVGGHTCADSTQWTAWTSSNSLPTTSGNYYLATDVTLSSRQELPAGTDITICLNGKTITGVNQLMKISGTASFCDCKDGAVIGTKASANGGIFYNASDSVLNLYSGSFTAAPGVTMNQGSILYADRTSTINLYNAALSGGTVSAGGGNVYINNSSIFNMYGGTISGGTAANGGNVYVRNSTFNLYGGIISGGSASTSGGNIYATGATATPSAVTVSGGTVSGGTAASYAGNIYVGAYTHLTTTGGTIAAGTAAANKGDNIFAGSSFSQMTYNGGKVYGELMVGYGDTVKIQKFDAPVTICFQNNLTSGRVKVDLSQLSTDCATMFIKAIKMDGTADVVNSAASTSHVLTLPSGVTALNQLSCVQPYAGYILDDANCLVADSTTALAPNANGIITLTQDTAADITLTQDTVLNLNGFDLYGKIVKGSRKLYLMDTATDDMDTVAAYGICYSTISGKGETVIAQPIAAHNNYQYLVFPEAVGVSAQRIVVELTAAPQENAGSVDIAYTANIRANAKVQAALSGANAYGLKVYQLSSSTIMDNKAAQSFTSGSQGNNPLSVAFTGVLKSIYTDNAARALVPIHAQLYLNLDGQDVVVYDASPSFQQIMETADTQWSDASTTAQDQQRLVALYAAYTNQMRAWNIPNIKANSNITLPTVSPETESALRQQVVDRMRQILTVAWTPVEDFSVTSDAGTAYFEAGTTYYGFPYGPESMSWEQFQSRIVSVDADGVATVDPQNPEWFCIDCADTVYWSWTQISSGISFSLTGNAMNQNGTIPVGNYAYDPALATYEQRTEFFNYVYRNNSKQTMYEAYAQLKPGDALLKYGHMIMAGAEPVVVRNSDGTINGQESYVLILEQNAKGYTANDPNKVDVVYTFADLFGTSGNKLHIPMTMEAFTYGEDEEVAAVVSEANATPEEFLANGCIVSNYRINGVQIRITDDTGSVREITVYTYNYVGNNWLEAYTLPNNGTRIDMASIYSTRKTEFTNFFAGLELTAGEEYTYEIYVRTGDGDTWDLYAADQAPVKAITFTAA